MIIKNLVPGCRSTVATGAAVEDDPQRRRPDIAVAEANLHWTPKVRSTRFLGNTHFQMEGLFSFVQIPQS